METFEDISDELIIVGSRYGVLSDVLSPLYEKGAPIEQEKINEVLGHDEFYLMPDPNDHDPYAVGAFTTDGSKMGFLWMYQAPALRQWIDENHARFVTIRIKRMNTKYGLMIARADKPIRLKPCDRISLDIDMDWAANLPMVMRSISIQSLALSVALLQDELAKSEEWTERLQVRVDNLLRNLPSDLSAHHHRDAIDLYKTMKSSKIEAVRQQCDIVLQAFVHRGSADQMQWWVKEWLPNFFQEVSKGDWVRLYETADYTLERVESILKGAPANLFYLYKVNREQFAYHLYYTALPREIYSRLLTLLAVREAMMAKGHPDWPLLARAIENCQEYFWANSSYAVVYCICRDDFKWRITKTDFETKVEEVQYKKKRSFTCPAGTIANAFSDNPIYNDLISEWDNKASKRIIKLRNELRKVLKSSI
jgi:hypothetical protein